LLLLPEGRAQVAEHTELLQKDRYCNVAMEGQYLTVFQMEDVAAWGLDLLVRRRNHPRWKHQVPLVCTVQRKLYNHDVVVVIPESGVKTAILGLDRFQP